MKVTLPVEQRDQACSYQPVSPRPYTVRWLRDENFHHISFDKCLRRAGRQTLTQELTYTFHLIYIAANLLNCTKCFLSSKMAILFSMSFCRYCSLNFNIYFYWFPVWCNIISLCRMPVRVLKIFAYQTCTLVEVLAFSIHWFFSLSRFPVYPKWPERSLENLNLPVCLNPLQYSCLENPTDRGA